MHFHFLAAKELGPRVNQESAKQVDDPIEPANQAHAHHDEDAAHDERAQYAPEKHLVLLPAGNAEIAENQQEDEQIINAEGELDQVAGGELQGGGAPAPKINQHRETSSQGDPHDAPAHGF